MKSIFTLVFALLLGSYSFAQLSGSWQGVLIQNNADGTTSNYAVWMFINTAGNQLSGNFRSERAGTSFFKVSKVKGTVEENSISFTEGEIETEYTEEGFAWCSIKANLKYDQKNAKLKGVYSSLTKGCLNGELVLLKTNRDFNLGEIMKVENVESLDVVKNAILGKESIVGKQFILKDVVFQSGEYNIASSSFSYLNQIVVLLEENKAIKIHLKGHTDNDGNDETNFILSQKRAKSVANYLIKNRISKDRIFFEGFGESRPLIENSSNENKQTNRRVELQIISQ